MRGSGPATTSAATVEALAASIFRREFMPLFAPVTHLATGSLLGWEAQGVWIHGTRDLVPAAAYTEPAERAGLLESVDEIVADRAMRAFRRAAGGEFGPTTPWLALSIAGGPARCVTAVQWLGPLLGTYRIPHSHVVLCLPDVTPVSRRRDVAHSLASWRTLGGLVAVDAETFFSGPATGPKLPIDFVTISAAHTAKVAGDPSTYTWAAEVVDRAARVGAQVFAQGVASEDARVVLARLGIDAGVGPHLGEAEPEIAHPDLALALGA